jgi:hypothetical protein
MRVNIITPDELSQEARSLLNTLRSRGGSIRGDLIRDKVMWLYWAARPGEVVPVAAFKELYKRGLIEYKRGLQNGESDYWLSALGRL